MMALSVLVYTQHLLGVGHVFRAKRVAEAIAARGHTTTLVLGGFEIPDLTVDDVSVHQLPPIRARDATYQTLVTRDDVPIDADFEARRRTRLLAIADEVMPDVVILEGFPLARRKFRFELVPLLEASHARTPRPLVVVSARDVLQRPRREDRIAQSIETFKTFCDALLLHGEATYADASTSFPELAQLADQTHYTGIVGPTIANDQCDLADETFDVIVSAGGGAVGYDLLRAAVHAKTTSNVSNARWLVLSGPGLPDAQFESLHQAADANGITLERFRPNLRALMANAQLSIQQAGYNTIADLLAAQCRGVLVPFAAGGETEQTARAAALAEQGRAVVVEEASLTPETMSAAINAALRLPEPDTRPEMNGAARSAELVEELFAQHRQRNV